jgi:IS30 family transposase
MKYHQITLEERIAICTLRREGLSAAAIAKRLGRHRSTISRECRRNRDYEGYYRFRKAHEYTVARRRRCRRGRQHSQDQYNQVNALLIRKFSPDQISGYLKKSGQFRISHETIYRHIWADRAAGGCLYQHLRQSPKQRRKRYRSYDSRGRLAKKRMISERPTIVEARRQMGHWEIDTVMGRGSKHCIVTIVERITGYTLIGKLPNRTTVELNKRVIRLIDAHYPVRTIVSVQPPHIETPPLIRRA